MVDIKHRLRHMVETVVPWFDREQVDRQHAELRREMAESRAVRARATQTIQASYRDYADRVRR